MQHFCTKLHPSYPVPDSVMNLSKEEAVWFISEILGITIPKNLEDNRLAFLNELVKAIHSLVPFQSITLLGQAEATRHKPTLEEIKTAMMGGLGGLCYTIGVFTTFLLRVLGYKAHLSAGSIHDHPDNHVIVIVQDLTTPGSKHLVDAWCGWPTCEAIPLDFEEESPVYHCSFLEFKFIREHDYFVRFHRNDRYAQAKPSAVEWRKVCKFDSIPRDLSHFDQSMTDVYTIPGARSPFLVSFRAVIYNDLKLVAIKDTTLLLENDCHEVEARKLQSREELIETVKRYFPKFTAEDVTNAADYLHLLD